EPLNFEASLDKILPLFALLKEGEIKLEGGTWLFSGTPLTAADAESIRATFARDRLSEAGWSLALAAPAPAELQPAQVATVAVEPAAKEPAPAAVATQPEPVAAPAAEPAPQVQAVPAAPSETLELCRANLSALSAQNGILFRSGAAILAEGTQTILASIADAISHCPDVAIDVAGHTDSDGDAAANLALSVARAEAVVAALINLGVGPERLYAIGYGESQPVADNATPAGKAQNRRIVVSVREGD
ncbi:MAG TPA: OmpA family protein, partial [Devosia sp.]|nr:OmpA family protein [Devosia sp.]